MTLLDRAFGVCLCAAGAVGTYAQPTAALRGQVFDPSAAAIPGASITATGPNGAARTASSDNAGGFTIVGLTPGQYQVHATAPGFAPLDRLLDVSAGRVTSLELTLAIALDRQEVTVDEKQQIEVDPAANAGALVVAGNDLDILSANPEDLEADLLALAGPAVGPNGGQIFVDGFSNGQLPPKESIREVRINSDPFSAQYDRVGFGRVEILTRPGTDRFRGSASFTFADSALNSRNPFATAKPDTQMRQTEANASGPLGKRTSFDLELYRSHQDTTALINAVVLDNAYQPTRYVANVPIPNARTQFSPRIDYALTPNITWQGRYSVNRAVSENNNIGGTSLLDRAVTIAQTLQNLALTQTAVIGTRLINETRFQYRRSRTQRDGVSNSPTIQVLDAFYGGAGPYNSNYYHSDNFEFQNNLSYTRGRHLVRAGVRIRKAIENGFTTADFNGTFTFTSIQGYAITQRGLAQGLTIDEIRTQGGGASQYTVLGGNPLVGIGQMDAAPFVQDDWKVLPNFTLSMGLRYEMQTNLKNKSSWAPRLGLAWGIGRRSGRANQPKTVLRAGFGLFYDRFSEGNALQAKRQNGINQQIFVVASPSFYPIAPPISQLISNRLPQAIRTMDPTLQAPQIIQSAIGIERQLPKNITLSVNFSNSRGVHQFRGRNINAPLPRTYTGPGTGVFPYGFAAGQIFQYESNAMFKQTQLTFNVNGRISARLTMFANYTLGKIRSNSEGISNMPGDVYDLASEWGRAGSDIRHRLQFGGTVITRYRIQFNPQLNFTTAPPFNITIGKDLNGDQVFNDRPTFATDLNRPSVRVTPWGVFDLDPLPGRMVIPRNYAQGYGNLGVNLRVSRTWDFGERGSRGSGSPAARRYGVTASVQARNVFNSVNPGNPGGNLSSPLFGVATTIQGGQQNANRRIEMQVRVSF